MLRKLPSCLTPFFSLVKVTVVETDFPNPEARQNSRQPKGCISATFIVDKSAASLSNSTIFQYPQHVKLDDESPLNLSLDLPELPHTRTSVITCYYRDCFVHHRSQAGCAAQCKVPGTCSYGTDKTQCLCGTTSGS